MGERAGSGRNDNRWERLFSGDRVVIIGRHPWNSYAGTIVGIWPNSTMDWLVQLDNGQNIGANEQDLQKVN